MIFYNKITTLAIEIVTAILSIVKSDMMIEAMGGAKFILALAFLILCTLITLSDSPKEDR